MKTSLLTAPEEVVGHGSRMQSDWFKECSEVLTPLIDEQNACRERMLHIPSLRREFRKCQHTVKVAVDKAREDWVFKVAGEADKAMKKGNVQWDCMKKSQIITMVINLFIHKLLL